ncbi:MAG: hypothetical protein OEY99_01530 [Aigarchaeota archaeon]|nr:hypothetical protein [Aigarchaeota archaeon]MDH5702870.1 hypothetical protein [Aigarchaeota archaeon]
MVKRISFSWVICLCIVLAVLLSPATRAGEYVPYLYYAYTDKPAYVVGDTVIITVARGNITSSIPGQKVEVTVSDSRNVKWLDVTLPLDQYQLPYYVLFGPSQEDVYRIDVYWIVDGRSVQPNYVTSFVVYQPVLVAVTTTTQPTVTLTVTSATTSTTTATTQASVTLTRTETRTIEQTTQETLTLFTTQIQTKTFTESVTWTVVSTHTKTTTIEGALVGTFIVGVSIIIAGALIALALARASRSGPHTGSSGKSQGTKGNRGGDKAKLSGQPRF